MALFLVIFLSIIKDLFTNLKANLLKRFTQKLKLLFGSNSKAKKSKETESKEPASKQKKQNPNFNENKSHGGKNHPQRNKRKKETPEEYRARKERQRLKREQEQGKEKAETAPPKNRTNKPAHHQKKPFIHNWDKNEFNVPIEDGKTRFHDLQLPDEILHAIFDLKFEYCTPVQAETLPKSIIGDDVTAQAQTGTGKTAAFLITILNHILKNPIDKKRRHGTPRALILAPTRELVMQIEKDARGLAKYTETSILSLLGGIGYGKQQQILKSEAIDILICTPGRLIDFMQKKFVNLQRVEILVIDEADRMLDMGFIPSVKKIVLNTPQKSKRQTMFFTATMTADVKNLAESWTRQAFEINVSSDEVAVDSVDQITYITTVDEKPTLLYNLIMQKELERVLIFVNRRSDSRKLKETLDRYGISCALLTGDVDQKQRIRRLERFRGGNVRVLVATDVASRGIHIEGISHVINYNMPQDIEDYVHRIGRTGRAGATGTSINFADEHDSYELYKLEEYLGKKIECDFPEDELLNPIPELPPIKKSNSKSPKKNYRKKPNNYRPKS